ncbi:MAG TPA: glycosyltransferase family 39 protein [Casimicrobiaceae bacterium]|nr:glycosyltransferase family 39 protein [Casimicrobiaceae bacterium]
MSSLSSRTIGARLTGIAVRERAFPWADAGTLAALVAVQLLVIAVVAPRGNFGIDDDWTYAHGVTWLLREHVLRLSPWATASVLPQTLLGGAVAALFGDSFEVLRHLTQTIAALAAFAAYACLRVVRVSPRDAFVGALTLLSVPVWPILANSFMSDVYGLLFALGAVALMLRLFASFSWPLLVAAAILCALGALERQIVVVVPVAFAIAWLWRPARLDLRKSLVALAPLALTLAAMAAFEAYLAYGPGVPEGQRYVSERLTATLVRLAHGDGSLWRQAGENLVGIAGYLGWFTFGWFAWRGLPAHTGVRRVVICGAVALSIAALAIGWLPPYREQFVIDRAGIGPFTLYDAQPRGLASFDRSPGILWRIAGVGAACGVAALAGLALATVKHFASMGWRSSPERVFIAATIAGYVAPFAITDYFDRYLIYVVPLLFALWAMTWPAQSNDGRWRRALAGAWLLASLAFGAMATHDYFAWNRARWDAIHYAESLGATLETLDGGYEYNGDRRLAHGMVERTQGKSWWWVKDDRYVVAFGMVPGYDEVRAFPVARWLPRSPLVVRLLLRRAP